MADALLETAISNWGPRFTASGVDASDYARVTAELSTWDEWCAAWTRAADQHDTLARIALDEGRHLSAGEAFQRAATYYHFGKFLFVHDLDQARSTHQRAVEALTRALPLVRPTGRRVEIPYRHHHLVGVLRTPDSSTPHPTVILVPGLDSAKEEFSLVEAAFHARGLATFSLDGPGQGESEWDFAIEPDWAPVGAAVLQALESCDEVDSDRVGMWGVSLGGYYAARLACADLPIRATVALAGPFNLADAWDHLNPLTRAAFRVRSHSGSDDEAREVAAQLSLAGHAAAISRPLLVIFGGRDRLFDVTHAERLVAAVPHAELLLLPEGNHGCANVVYRHRPYSADWLAHHLGASAPTNSKESR